MYADWLNTYKKTQYKHILCKHRIILRAFINRIYLKTSSMAFCASISLNEIQHSKLSLEILSPPFRSFNRLTFFFVYDVERRTQMMSLSTGLRHFFVPTVGANATLWEIVSAKSSQYFSTVSLVPVCLPPPPPLERTKGPPENQQKPSLAYVTAASHPVLTLSSSSLAPPF